MFIFFYMYCSNQKSIKSSGKLSNPAFYRLGEKRNIFIYYVLGNIKTKYENVIIAKQTTVLICQYSDKLI